MKKSDTSRRMKTNALPKRRRSDKRLEKSKVNVVS